MRSIFGKGKLSFGHALFMSVKSIQSRHLPLAFLTSTTLASHSGYSTSLIAHAWRSLLTSSLMAFCLSGAKLLRFCLTGLKNGLVFNLWVIIAGVDSAHVCLLPCENVPVLSQKLREEAFEVFC